MSATAVYRYEGCKIDYTPDAAVSAGDVVVQGDLVAIATRDIDASKLGALATEGVFEIPKASGAGTAIASGKRVYWDATNKQATESSGGAVNKLLGTTVLAAADADTTVQVKLAGEVDPDPLRYASVAASAAVSNTTTETAFDKSHTIKANTFKVGDVLRVRAQVIATATNGTDTLNLKLKIGSTVIAATGAIDVANNDIGYIDALIVVRTIGASGTMVATGVQGLGAEGTVTAKPFKLASAALDTTADQTITVSATWSVASSSDSCRLDVLAVERLSQ